MTVAMLMHNTPESWQRRRVPQDAPQASVPAVPRAASG
jgi:hypothetical protein